MSPRWIHQSTEPEKRGFPVPSKPNLIIGQYMTHLPRGRGLLDGAAIAADFSTKAI